MYKIINIGEKQVPVLATASTNVYFKHIFGDDPIVIQSSDAYDTSQRISFAHRLAFVIARQAQAQDDVNAGKAASIRDAMQGVSEDDYIDWLDGIDFSDLQEALGDVMEVYAGAKATSKAKKE